MSFGFSVSDGFTIIQLAWSTYEGAKRACSEHDGLTREMHTLCNVLSHLKTEVENPDSLIHKARKSRRKELRRHIAGCEEHLRRIEAILKKYNSLAEEEKSVTQLWNKVRFSSGGPLQNVLEIRQKISTYTTAINMSLQLLTQGSQGKVERMMSHQRGELKGIRESIDLLLAKSSISSSGSTHEGSTMSTYSHDDEKWWRELRRGLKASGYNSKVLKGHMGLIQQYVKELADKGIFEDAIRKSSDGGGREDGSNRSQLSLPSGDGFLPPDEVAELPATTPYMINREFGQERILPAPIPTHAMSVLVRRIGYLEEQLLRSPNILKVEAAQEEEDSETNQSSATLDIETEHVDRPVSPLTEVQGEQSTENQSDEQPQISVAEFLSMVDKGFVHEDEEPLDSEQLVKARGEAFGLLPLEERKKVITLQDPKDKKYSFPYYLVTKWEGMKYLMEQAFLRTGDLEQCVAKGEYDLINSNGAVIMWQLWETFVEPDMEITMYIRPTQAAPTPTPEPAPPPRSSSPMVQEFLSPVHHYPPPRPVTRFEHHSSHCRSYPSSISKSSSGSSSTSSSKSKSKSKSSRSFWGFKQRPKKRARSPQRWIPPPRPRMYYPPRPETPPPRAPAVYTYKIPGLTMTPPKVAKEIEWKSDDWSVRGFEYPMVNDEGAPIFEMA